MERTREFLESIGLPGGDAYELPTSEKRFPDGGQYRFEVPGIQSPGSMKALLAQLEDYNIFVHRVTQTKGIMSLTNEEIDEMVDLAHGAGVELVLAIGPRATTDTSASVNTPEGQRMGYRLRGQEQIVRSIEDVKRATKLGVRSFLVYDEGCLWVLSKFREAEEIPRDCRFKVSAHTGWGNPCSARVFEMLGADTINPVRDLQLQMLGAIRKATDLPLDLHTENPVSSGGFVRHYEVPQMIKVAAPIYLKTGGSVASAHSWETTIDEARKRAKQILLVKRVIDEYFPEAVCSPRISF